MSSRDQDRSVVVGVDGSDGSLHALAWAVDKASRPGASGLGPITAVTTFVVGPFFHGFGTFAGPDPDENPYRQEATIRLIEAVEKIDAGLVDRARVIENRAGPGLVEASADATLLVVGSRGRSALVETLFGSVGSYCVKHAKVPVAVIPRNVPSSGALSRLVVGLDGSENGRAALEWALRNADPNGVVIGVGAYNSTPLPSEGYIPDSKIMERETRDAVESDVAIVTGRVDGGPRLEIEIRPGDPRLELPKAASAADLLVVGARGHRAVAHLLLGSVTTSLTHHATVATVVVPHP